ncbi:hypothetical protein C8R45DRAFT_271973 [Mycena sanguinolenta]|nr:hypothetical protein C8R45DRAFT_271973 [Mycena sanguinolenta]
MLLVFHFHCLSAAAAACPFSSPHCHHICELSNIRTLLNASRVRSDSKGHLRKWEKGISGPAPGTAATSPTETSQLLRNLILLGLIHSASIISSRSSARSWSSGHLYHRDGSWSIPTATLVA